jgi:cell division protein FtsI/penicillin-binding protein 2
LLKSAWYPFTCLPLLGVMAMAWDQQSVSTQPAPPAVRAALAASPCVKALPQGAVCAAASTRALEIISASKLEAVVVVQDVRTGALVAFAASSPVRLDVTTPILPLSFSKVLLAASWWDNHQPDRRFDSTKGSADSKNPAYRNRVSVHDTVVGGSDSAGRQMALALRTAVGARKVLADFQRYGFEDRSASPLADQFWGELAPVWARRLTPAHAYVSLTADTSDTDWADAMSLGEAYMKVTALHVSRFLQAVGNAGLMLAPVAREERPGSTVGEAMSPPRHSNYPVRVMEEATALQLQAALRDTVQRGTASSVSQALKGTGWQMGGKTGSGPGPMPIGPESDGWFAGLVFAPDGEAQFTVATYVRRGGFGGGNAARISAELARYVVGGSAKTSR